jgi:hypothetical protein
MKKYDNLLKINLPKMLTLGRFAVVCVFLLGFTVVGKAVTLWHNTNTTTITAGLSVACATGGRHTDNSYWRSFTPSTFGQTGTFFVSGVRIGVETSTVTGASQPITVRIYTNTGGAFPAGTRTLIATANTTVIAGTLFFRDISVAAPGQPVATEIVVEIFTPDGTTAGHGFFIGSNSLGQAAPGYISAAPCGITTPTTLAAVGFPNTHILIGLTGGPTTAADVSVSGRVTTAEGRGVRGAVVTLTNGNGEVRNVSAGSRGNYRFDDVEPGQTYVVAVRSRRFTFATQVLSINDNLSDIDFVAQ